MEKKKCKVLYERINILKDFKEASYVKKVLKLYDDGFNDVLYYNNRDMSEIPCRDGDFLIMSELIKQEKKTITRYSLIEVDFEEDDKYKIMMSLDNGKYSDPKGLIYQYLIYNSLFDVYKPIISTNPHIPDSGIGLVMYEIFNNVENKSVELNKEDSLKFIMSNYNLSDTFKAILKEFNKKEVPIDMLNFHSSTYLNLVFKENLDGNMTIENICSKILEYHDNYIYNM